MTARRQSQQGRGQVEARPACEVGLARRRHRLVDATRSGPVEIGRRLGVAAEQVRDRLQLRALVLPVAQQRAHRQRPVAGQPVHLHEQRQAVRRGQLQRRRVEAGEDGVPVEGGLLLLDRLDEGLHIPCGQRAHRRLLLVGVELGVELEVLAAHRRAEGAVERERVVERVNGLGQHADDVADALGVERPKLAQHLAQAFSVGAARVAQVLHQGGELGPRRRQRAGGKARASAGGAGGPRGLVREARVELRRFSVDSVHQRQQRQRHALGRMNVLQQLHQRGALLGEALLPLQKEDERVAQVLGQRRDGLLRAGLRLRQLVQPRPQKLGALGPQHGVAALRERQPHAQLLRGRGLDCLGDGVQEILLQLRGQRGLAQHLAKQRHEVRLARQLRKLLREQLRLELVFLQLGVAKVNLLEQAAEEVDKGRLAIEPEQVGNFRDRRLLVLLVDVLHQIPQLRENYRPKSLQR